MDMITKADFVGRFKSLPETLKSTTHGKVYSNIRVNGDNVSGNKESGKSFNISISLLYDAYENGDYHTTNALLNYVTGRNGAPAKAIIDYVLNDNDSFTRTPSEKAQVLTTLLDDDTDSHKSRKDSDEEYIIDLCDEVLQAKASRQHRFPFLLGDGTNPTRLPVDAYYDELKLVVEYYELQHTESVDFFDKPDKLTVSGVSRGEQRKIYDQRRREVLPQHGISLVIFNYSDFAYDASKAKRLIRNHDDDIKVIREKLNAYLND